MLWPRFQCKSIKYIISNIINNDPKWLWLSYEIHFDRQRKYIPFNKDVGKSSLLLRFVENKFPNQHDIKLCVDFGSKLIEIDNRRIKLHIWDMKRHHNVLNCQTFHIDWINKYFTSLFRSTSKLFHLHSHSRKIFIQIYQQSFLQRLSRSSFNFRREQHAIFLGCGQLASLSEIADSLKNTNLPRRKQKWPRGR